MTRFYTPRADVHLSANAGVLAYRPAIIKEIIIIISLLERHALPVESTLDVSFTIHFLSITFRYFSNVVNDAPLHICGSCTYCKTAQPKRQKQLFY